MLILVFGSTSAFGADMRKGPYLIYPGQNTQMQVLWQVTDTETCTLDWGLDTSYGLGSVQTTEYGDDHQHTYTITDLTPGTAVFYRVTVTGVEYAGSFNTAPSDSATDVTFLVYGNTGSNPDRHDYVAGGMLNAIAMEPEFKSIILGTGNLVNYGEYEPQWDNYFFNPSMTNVVEIHRDIPFNTCIGGREVYGGDGTVFRKYFPYPFVADHYWSFDYGPIHFVVLDQTVDLTEGSPQLTWLESDLASTTRYWKFIILHNPGWSAGAYPNDEIVQDYVQPLCEKYGVLIVFAGRHAYYARAAVNGVFHVTTGGGGMPLQEPDLNMPRILIAKEFQNFCLVSIHGPLLTFKATKPDNNILNLFYYASDVVPDIKVNDSDGPLALPATDPVTVSIGLQPGQMVNQFADWWVFVKRESGNPYWCVWDPGASWVRSKDPYRFLGLKLTEFANLVVLGPRTLPAGTYIWNFWLDDKNFKLEGTYSDSCELTIYN